MDSDDRFFVLVVAIIALAVVAVTWIVVNGGNEDTRSRAKVCSSIVSETDRAICMTIHNN